MGQKIHPHGLRVGVIKDWDSRWFARDNEFGDLLVEDYNLRKALKEKYYAAGIPRIEIERDASRVRVNIHCAKPGLIIGKGGKEIEELRLSCEKVLKKPVSINIVEVRNPDADAQLVAESIASQLEKRTSFRRAMKLSIGRAMKLGVRGIKTMVSGRLGGAEIARTESYHEGTIPLQTIRADIDYGFAEANTTYGKIGVKVWIYKGEVLSEVARTQTGATLAAEDKKKFGDRRNGDRRDRRNGDRREGGRGFGGERREGGRNFGDRRGGQNRTGDRPMRNSDRPMRAPVAPAAPKETTEGGAN